MTAPIEFTSIAVASDRGGFPEVYTAGPGGRISWSPGEPWVRVRHGSKPDRLFPVASVRGEQQGRSEPWTIVHVGAVEPNPLTSGVKSDGVRAQAGGRKGRKPTG